MKKVFIGLFNLVFATTYSQQNDISMLLNKIQQAQDKIQTAIYTVERTDSTVQDIVRVSTGNVMIQKDANDSMYGFLFKGKVDDIPYDIVYDGFIGYEADTEKRTYIMFQKSYEIQNLLYRSGGWLVMPELLKIDTSGSNQINFTQDEGYYYLTISYPDIKKYDVEKRRKVIVVNKQSFLPISVRSHQETLGKIQDLYWEIKTIQINQPLNYDFAALPFLNDYVLLQPTTVKPPVFQLIDRQAPDFSLKLLDGNKFIVSSSFKGKAVLLDFWEVWCGPCISSIPKVTALYDKYKSKGLEVYGVVNDLRNEEATKQFVKKRSLGFPILKGTKQFQKDFKFDGTVPLYILINREGKIVYVHYGFSDDIELLIQETLADN